MYVKYKQSATPALGPGEGTCSVLWNIPSDRLHPLWLRARVLWPSFFFFNNQRRVLFLLFERLGKPCQSSCRQLGELGYTGTTFNVEEKGKASWEQAGSAGLMCLTSQPVKCHRENLASEHGSAGGLQRREHPLKAHSPSPAQAGSRCICAQGGAPDPQGWFTFPREVSRAQGPRYQDHFLQHGGAGSHWSAGTTSNPVADPPWLAGEAEETRAPPGSPEPTPPAAICPRGGAARQASLPTSCLALPSPLTQGLLGKSSLYPSPACLH